MPRGKPKIIRLYKQLRQAPKKSEGQATSLPDSFPAELNPPAKANTEQSEMRTFQVYQLLLNGYDAPHIIEFCKQKGWGIQKAQVYAYIGKARAMIKDNYDPKIFGLLQDSVARRMKLFEACRMAGDRNTAHEILRDLDKLLGKYPEIKVKANFSADKGLVDLLNGSEVKEAKEKLKKD